MTILGTVPGFEYTVGDAPGIMCMFCLREGIPLMAEGLTPPHAPAMGLCEPCSTLAAWAWQRVTGWTLPGLPFAQTPSAALMLVVRERENDFLIPFDVLMVSHKDDPGAFALPGGKVEKNEKIEETAVRELAEETGLVAWPAGVEALYCGYSPRGRLIQVCLCRGFEGEAKSLEGLKIEWKPWPPSSHSGMFSGFYKSLEAVFMMRWKLQKESTGYDATVPLSTQCSSVCADLVRLSVKREGGKAEGIKLSADEMSRMKGYLMALSWQEEKFAEFMGVKEMKWKESIALAALPAPPSYRPPKTIKVKSAAEIMEEAGVGEGDEHEPDENAPPGEGEGEDKGEGEEESGFVRGRR